MIAGILEFPGTEASIPYILRNYYFMDSFPFTVLNIFMAYLQERSFEDVGDEESAVCTLPFWTHPRFSSGGGLMNLNVVPVYCLES